MMGSFLTRGLVMVFGYAYPAYECYKIVEKNRPEIEQLRFWCQYWILVAMLAVFERVADTFVSWVPMYSEAKLAFYIYLWYPKTQGATYVYNSFFRHYVAQHETEIDRNLLEIKTSARDMAIVYCQKALAYGQTRVFEILHYVASQTTSKEQQSSTEAHKPPPTVRPREPAPPTVQQPQQPTLDSSTSPTEQQHEPAQETDVSYPKPRKASSIAAAVNAQPTVDALLATESNSSQLSDIESETSKDEPVPSASSYYENSHQTPQDIYMDEAIPVTNARLRNTGNR
ncbi:hypothetical protein MKW94_017928 [Papaver nudicaule]|uniref:HVA22-like protein n=1 Tax=Papaver nudicaule TaxID=74823 RepID=A0AA41RUU4_PAPNU|nr:hypothetical protein [Papaver nudicaule]